MQLTIDRAILARELAIVATCADKKSTLPILGNVRLEAGDGLRLTCTDLEIGMTATAECEVRAPGVTTLPVKRLVDLCRTLPDGPVKISTGESHWTSITAARVKTRIAGMNAESFPELPVMPDGFEVDVAIFARQLSHVSYAISTEESKLTLGGALVEFGPTLRCVATDGHRLALTETEANTSAVKFLMPRRVVASIDKLRDGAEGGAKCTVAVDDNHLFFRVGTRTLTARRMAGNFPDFERVLPKSFAHTVTIPRDALRSALEGSITFAEEKTHSIRMTFAPGEVTIAAASVDAGEYEQSVGCESDADLAIGFNARYLLDFLGATVSEKVTARLVDAKTAMELRPADQDGVRYVVMPKRI